MQIAPVNKTNITETGSCLRHGRCQQDCIWLIAVGLKENDIGVRIYHSTVSGGFSIF